MSRGAVKKARAFFELVGRTLSDEYARLFSIKEIENSSVLQWMFGASLFFFYATFNKWMPLSWSTVEAAKNGTAVCWPYFQDCASLFFLRQLPYGYSQTEFYMILYGIMLLIVWSMWRKKWVIAHGLMFVMLLWEIVYIFGFAYMQTAPYHYYHIALTSALLFVPFKEFFLKLTFVFMYFMSSTIKLDEGWVLGTYFTSLKLGLPIFPDSITPLITNFVIFMQIVGSWFLLSKRWILQRGVLTYFAFFHLYSGIFVNFFYPTVALPPLLILFGPMYKHTPIPFSMKTIAGWSLIAILAVFQIIGFVGSDERRLTLEGNSYGMFMFEANHQCIATTKAHMSNPRPPFNWETPMGTPCVGFYCRVKDRMYNSGSGSVREQVFESATAWNRCDPYEWWARLHALCGGNSGTEKISFQFDHSINGGPFYRIVDLDDICSVAYKSFGHNGWIRLSTEATIVGYPVENNYHY